MQRTRLVLFPVAELDANVVVLDPRLGKHQTHYLTAPANVEIVEFVFGHRSYMKDRTTVRKQRLKSVKCDEVSRV